MRKYEAMALLRPEINDADVVKFTDRYKAVIEEKGGTVASAAKWDKRKLTFEIKGCKEATYVLFDFQAPAGLPAELGRQLRNNDSVIRHRIFLMEE